MEKLLFNRKKIIGFGAIFVVLLAIVLPIVAHASTLKVTNTLTGKVYDAYTLFTVNSDGDYLFNDNSGFKSGFDEYRAAHPNDFTLTLVEEGIYKVKANESFTEDGAKALAETMSNHYNEWKDEIVSSKTAEGNTVTFDSIPDGYYIVHSSSGNVLSMVAVNGYGEIQEKNTSDRWCTANLSLSRYCLGYHEKVDVKTTVTFTQNYTGDKSLAVVNEYFENGWINLYGAENVMVEYDTYRNDPSPDNPVPASWYTTQITEGGKGYTVLFNSNAHFDAGQAIRITCRANCNEGLSIYDSNKGMKDEHQCFAGVISKDEQGATYVAAVDTQVFRCLGMSLVKTPSGNNLLLQGAKFKVYSSNDLETPLYFNKDGNSYTVTLNTTQGAINEVEVGVGDIKGIGNDTYYFEETQAPEGYNMLTEKVNYTLTNNDSNFAEINHSSEGDVWNGGGLRVENKQGIVLPSTGGIGTILFVIIGAGIIISVIAYRMGRKQKMNYFENSTI